MPTLQHEVPTHLNVEDKVLFGLTVKQFLYLLVGSSVSYAIWGQLAPAGDALRLACVAVCTFVTLGFALLRPGGRAVEEWLAAGLVFAALPRRTTWQVPEPVAADWRPVAGGWQELTPTAEWMAEEGG